MSSINVKQRANVAARIFDILGWVVLVVGSLSALIFVLVAIFGLFGDNKTQAFFAGMGGALGAVVYTALMWASITLATAVAGYVSQRSEH
jgi:uncharacterized membrane protein